MIFQVSVMVRIDTGLESCASLAECNRAALLAFNTTSQRLEFDAIVPLPTGCNKFAIRQDPVTDFFYTLTNPVTQYPNPNGCVTLRCIV